MHLVSHMPEYWQGIFCSVNGSGHRKILLSIRYMLTMVYVNCIIYVSYRKAPLLAEYYQILSSLDYNYQQMVLQFKTLDDLTDITASVSKA